MTERRLDLEALEQRADDEDARRGRRDQAEHLPRLVRNVPA